MTIENRTLYNLYQSVKIQYAEAYLYGLYIEGFSGGVTIYAKGKALYRHTVYGDNKTQFCSYIGEWQKKDGETDTGALDQTRKMDGGKAAQKICEFTKIFEAERFNKFTVIGREFRKAVNGVDAINRGEKTHNICLSARDGLLDIASWPNAIESSAWQVKTGADASGAVMVDRKHLDNIKGRGMIEFSCLKHNEKLGLYVKCAIEAVFPVMDINRKRFLEVLEYEYCKPEPESKPGPQKERVIGDRYVEYSEDFSGFVVRTVSKNGNDSYAAGIAKSCGIPVGGVYRFNTPEEAEKWIVDNPVRQKRKRTAAITEKPPVKAEPVIAEKRPVTQVRTKKTCAVCGEKLVSKKKAVNSAYKCAECGKILCGKHSYSYVDGNNASITKNAPVLCECCYRIKYPNDYIKPEKKRRFRRAPKPIKENSAFTGWTYNKLGTKQTKVLKW